MDVETTTYYGALSNMLLSVAIYDATVAPGILNMHITGLALMPQTNVSNPM
jgi:hypothetical protein